MDTKYSRTEVNDTGIILVTLERFEKIRLPRINEIKEKLDHGDTLNEFNIEFLSEALHDTRELLPFLDRHPEYVPLISKVIHYYKTITDEALSNEKLSRYLENKIALQLKEKSIKSL